MRLFYALWPAPTLANSLVSWAEQARPATGGRIMRTETLHLTLAFLGNIDIETAEELIDATPVHRLEPGTLTLDQYGVFNRQRILWAGPPVLPTTCKPSTTACGSGCPATACKRPRNRSAPTSPCCATSTPPRPRNQPPSR